MTDSGVNAQYAAGLINEYRNAFINDYIKTLDESLHTRFWPTNRR